MINNAGINDTVADDVDQDESVITELEKISNVFRTNVIAPMLLSDKLKPLLKASSNPMIISVSSQMSRYRNFDGYNAEHWPYSTSKAALNFATAAFSINQPRIKAITVDPGWMKTRMGGKDAELEPNYTANCIFKLYQDLDSLQAGKLYSLDGEVLSF